MSSTETSNNKRRRASTTHHEESTAIRPRTTVVMSVASSGFESLVDDTHDTILQFLGKRSYGSYGGINKRCREIFLSKNLPKETYFSGYAPLSMIKEKFDRYDDGVVGQAIVAYNRNDIMQWALLEKRKWAIVFAFDIAAGVSLNTLKRVKNLVGDDAFTTMKINEGWGVSNIAARGEKLDVLKWLKTKGWFNPSRISFGMQTVAEKGNIPVLKWLIENGCTLGNYVFPSAAEGGHVNMLEFLKENKCPSDPESCMSRAARGGSLETIHWFLRNGCSFENVNKHVIKEAAEIGHLHVIKFFTENGFSINGIVGEYVSYGAGERGHLHILQWLHENDGLFNEWTFACAARNGNIDNLQWLLDINCPWDENCFSEAVEYNNLEVLEWLKEKGCPRGDELLSIVEESAGYEVIDWLRKNGFTVHPRRRLHSRRFIR